LDFGLIDEVNLDMYIPGNVLETMSDLEKKAAESRVRNWVKLLKIGR